MGRSSAEALARRFIQAWNAGQRHVVDELAAEDLTVEYTHFPEPFHGPEAFKDMLAQTHRHFPDLSIDVEAVVAGGDHAVVQWRYRGTFQNGKLFGVEASGQPVEVAGMTKYDIADGAIQREEGIVDTFGLMMQIGARPAPGDNT